MSEDDTTSPPESAAGTGTRWVRAAGWGLLVILALAALLLPQWISLGRAKHSIESLESIRPELPHLETQPPYISSHACQSCHPGEYASWHRSFHRTMTQIAVPENVVGKFDGTTIHSDGLEYRVDREGGEFWAEMPDPDVMMYVHQGGKTLAEENIPRVRQRVVMTTGSHHYQTYWVNSPRYDRLLQTLPLVYLIADQQWIPREDAFMRPPDDSGRFVTQWNHHCIRCHSTGGNPGLDTETGMLDTRVAELGISCEACHGPAEAHVRKHQNPVERYRMHFDTTADPSIVNPAKLDHRRSSEVCGQCHGVYVMRDEFAMASAREGALFRPGDDLHRTRYYIQHPANDPSTERAEELEKNPAFFAERWWEDGTILAGGREYTAMSVSACYTRGEISCLSCHSMHDSDPVDQLKPHMDSNIACVQCHTGPLYTTILESHTFHPAGSPGSNCLNCHMPHTTYALLGAIRSHQIESPNVRASARYGVPNACNLCHLDKTLAWTQEQLVERYGQAEMDLNEEQRTVSAALLWLLKGHAAQRVITAWHVGWAPAQEASGTDWLPPFQARLLSDPYGVVRYVAAAGLRSLPNHHDLTYNFLATKEEQIAQADRILTEWNQDGRVRSRTGIEILIHPDGSLMEEKVRAILSRRDDRPVTIKE